MYCNSTSRWAAFTFDTLAAPRIPASHRHPESVATGEFEVCSAQPLAGCRRTDQYREAILTSEASHHLRRAVCVFVSQYHRAAMKRLRSEAFGHEEKRPISLKESKP